MRKGNRTAARIFAVLLALVLACTATVGATLAWLTAKSVTVENTFTAAGIEIKLEETGTALENDKQTKSFKMIPGSTIAKDPEVTVKAGSEACWLFVKIEESDNFDTYMTYEIADGWTELTGVSGVTGVYYRKVGELGNELDADTSFEILAGDQVTVKSNVTMDMMKTAETSQPTLSFTAYAVQKANIADAATAWDQAKNL